MFDPILLVIALLAIVSLALPRTRRGPISRAFSRLGRRRALSCLLVGAVAFVLAAFIGFKSGLPVPAIHDEFSYLLAGDTFAHGRLTNPTHPMWEHFESFHIIHRPTYQSKYPPGTGLFLALGQVVAGEPIYGIWLSWALACAAVCWMLQGWLPPRWGLLGGLLAASNGEMLLEWASSYWGGTVAMLGGALVLGGTARIFKRMSVLGALAMAAGGVILALSRPYEGLLLCAPVGILLIGWLATRGRVRWGESLRRIVVPGLLVLLAGGGWTAYYNYRVTGSPTRLPYTAWVEEHKASKARHADIDRFHGSAALTTQQRLLRLWVFYWRWPLTAPLVMFPWMIRRPRIWLASFLLVLVVGRSIQLSHAHAHYVAPIAPVAIWLSVEGLRRMALARCGGRARGALLAAAIPLVYFVTMFLYVRARLEQPASVMRAFGLQRERLIRQLESDPGQDLVIVQYGPQHNVHQEWVYNAAEIDPAPVVWARDMGAERNRELVEYFSERRIWLVRPDDPQELVTPYRPELAKPAETTR